MEIRIALLATLLLAVGCNRVNTPPDLDPCEAKPGQAVTIGATDWNGYHFPLGRRHPKVVDKTGGIYSDILGPIIASWNELDVPADFSGESGWTIDVTVGAPEGALGLAEVSFGPNGHIVAGKVTMNPDAIERSGLGPNAPIHVLCQELGHEIGLGHERGMLDTCMNDCVGLGSRAEWKACLEHPDGRTPNLADAEMIRQKYPPRDEHDDGPGLTCQGRIVVHALGDYEHSGADHHDH